MRGRLIIEPCAQPDISGPPTTPGRSGAAPGTIVNQILDKIDNQIREIKLKSVGQYENNIWAGPDNSPIHEEPSSSLGHGKPGSDEALAAFLRALKGKRELFAYDT